MKSKATLLWAAAAFAADVGLPQLQPENGHAAVRNFREHDLVREFDELADDKLEELSHAFELSDASRVVQL